MIRIKNTSKKYNHHSEEIIALDQVNLTINEGEFVSVVGPSGCGKSTLLLLMGGMLSPSAGTVLIDNVDIYELSTNERSRFRGQHIGFLFQRFHLIPYLTAMENVAVPFIIQGVTGDEAYLKATQLLTRVQLEKRLDHKPGELSVGQQQRVALARMLANDPPVILADEPTGNLDPQTGGAIIDFLLELNKAGKTIVMVTHTPEAARMTSRRISLDNGVLLN